MMNLKMSTVINGTTVTDNRDGKIWTITGKDSKCKTIMMESDGVERPFGLSTVNRNFTEVVHLTLTEDDQMVDCSPSPINEEPAPVCAVEQPQEDEPVVKAEKKERKAREPKRTFEKLLADIPCTPDVKYSPNSKRNAVHVKRGNRRIFGYNGAIIVVNRKEYLEGIPYDTKNYGYTVDPTRENMLAILRNAQ